LLKHKTGPLCWAPRTVGVTAGHVDCSSDQEPRVPCPARVTVMAKRFLHRPSRWNGGTTAVTVQDDRGIEIPLLAGTKLIGCTWPRLDPVPTQRPLE
jgi:hypothetical protein